jgi:hypothetical protein
MTGAQASYLETLAEQGPQTDPQQGQTDQGVGVGTHR